MADYVIRATAADGQIRAFAATTRDLTETEDRLIIQVLWQQRHLED